MYKISNRANYNREHHTDSGFRNPWLLNHDEMPGGTRAVGWVLGKIFSGGAEGPGSDFRPVEAADLKSDFRHYRVHWLGHATVLIRTHAMNILTDPVFSDRVSPVSFAGPRRVTPVPLSVEELPEIHLIIISHDHYDHLDRASVVKLQQLHDPLFVVPLRMKDILLSWGISRVIELDWEQTFEADGFTVHCLPAKHFSGRGLTDRDTVLWASFLIEIHGKKPAKFYFAGDTGYAHHFRQVGEDFPNIDVALVPIGAYNPRWFMKRVHVDPEEAVQAFLDLGARQFLGIHWGTFHLADEPLRQPLERSLAEAERRKIDLKQFHVLPAGGFFDD